jgi:CRISPR-associated protein Csm2
MKSFWKDKQSRLIDPELFASRAEELAKEVFDEKRGNLNKSTQVRKFYDEVVRFGGLIQTDPSQFQSLLPYIKMLNAKAAYAAGRDLISPKFKAFISESLALVNDKDDFDAFAGFFEAFIGYYKFQVVKGGGS